MRKLSMSTVMAIAWCCVSVMATGCSHSVHQLYIGSMDPQVTNKTKGQWLEVESKEFVILGFEMNSHYVERAYRELQKKCSGRLAQVTTEHLTSYKFLSYDQKVVLKGFCLT